MLYCLHTCIYTQSLNCTDHSRSTYNNCTYHNVYTTQHAPVHRIILTTWVLSDNTIVFSLVSAVAVNSMEPSQLLTFGIPITDQLA